MVCKIRANLHIGLLNAHYEQENDKKRHVSLHNEGLLGYAWRPFILKYVFGSPVCFVVVLKYTVAMHCLSAITNQFMLSLETFYASNIIRCARSW